MWRDGFVDWNIDEAAKRRSKIMNPLLHSGSTQVSRRKIMVDGKWAKKSVECDLLYGGTGSG
jgi:lysozyme family protein